jgi:uncharacterized RDD family membrane protein YckC
MSSTVDNDNRFAPPTAHVEDVRTDGQQLGSRWARLGAALIDGLVQGVLYFALSYMLFGHFLPVNAGDSVSYGNVLLELVAGFVLFLLIQGYLLVTRGQTVGKKLLGLRIVRTDGSMATAGRLLGLRYLLGWVLVSVPVIGSIYGLVDSLMIFRASRKCLHDNIADTIVVKA